MAPRSRAAAAPPGATREGADALPSAEAIDVHVGQRLRARRIAIGMSQAQLGRRLGLTFSQVQKYEKGFNRVGAGRLFQLAALLDVPIQYFFEGLDDAVLAEAPRSASTPPGSARLQEALARIANPQARQAILMLAETMASEEEAKPPR